MKMVFASALTVFAAAVGVSFFTQSDWAAGAVFLVLTAIMLCMTFTLAIAEPKGR